MTNSPALVHKQAKLVELMEISTTMINMVEDFSIDAPDYSVNAVPVSEEKVEKDDRVHLNQAVRTAKSARNGYRMAPTVGIQRQVRQLSTEI